MRKIVKLVTALAVAVVACVVSAASASADPVRPMCTYAAGSGVGGADVSNLKCAQQRADAAGLMTNAVWSSSGSDLTDPGSGAYVAWLTSADGSHVGSDGDSGPIWTFLFDPAVVTFADFKRELQSQFGFNEVYFSAADSGWQWDGVRAYYKNISSAKH